MKAVVITGASSGIGHACTSQLVRAGFLVFAGVRKKTDGERLQHEGDGQVVPLEIEVTDEASIQRAVALVSARVGDRGLDGLVNNAGIGLVAPVEYMSAALLRKQFEVNFFGQVAVTQAFLPLIRKACGRIVNMGSAGGHISIPFGSALAASKSAFNSLNDALRMELHPFGIHVSIIEPGSMHTPAADKMLGDVEAVIRDLPPEGATRYGAALRESVRRGYEREQNGSPPEVVARAVEHALTAKNPRTRYPVGKDARTLTTIPRFLPDQMLDRIRYRLFGLPTKFGASH